MIVVFCSGDRVREVLDLLEARGVHGYTEIPETPGSGQTGRHMGSRAWPGKSSVVMAAADDHTVDALMGAVADLGRTCGPGEGVRAAVLPVERMI